MIVLYKVLYIHQNDVEDILESFYRLDKDENINFEFGVKSVHRMPKWNLMNLT